MTIFITTSVSLRFRLACFARLSTNWPYGPAEEIWFATAPIPYPGGLAIYLAFLVSFLTFIPANSITLSVFLVFHFWFW